MNRAVKTLIIVLLAGSVAGCRSEPSGSTAAGDDAFAVRNETGPGSVRFVTEVSATTISTLDTLRYRLTLHIGPGFEADFPDVYGDEHLAGFIVTRREQREETDEDGTRRVIRDYELEPEYTGELTLGAVHVYYFRENEISEEELITEPISITVVGEDLAADGRTLRPVRGLVTVEEFESANRRRWPWIVAIGISGLAVVGAGVWFVRRPRPEPPPPPAHETALNALRWLIEQKFVEQGRFEPFFVGLSQIVREYIERAFGVRAPEQTTEEFLLHAADAPTVAAHKGALEPFLAVADEVKFARYTPDPSVAERAFNTARDFILQTAGTGAIEQTPGAAERKERAA